MILLATNKRDLTSDFVVLELQRRGVDVFRLNSEDVPSAKVSFAPGAGWRLRYADRTIDIETVSAAYYRRPGSPDVSSTTDDHVREYQEEEWSAVLRSLWNVLEGRWLNSPFAILRAEDKPRQLSAALELGFNVPETLIGNDFDAVRPFVAAGDYIGKPLRHSLLERGTAGEVLFTSRVGPLTTTDRSAVELAPVIYQRELRKAHDLRVTVVGRTAYAIAIQSQAHPETSTDWRRGSRTDVAHEVVDLPADVAKRCVKLAEHLGLRFGAVDLVEDTDGQFWFLEINPNGQWAWIERRTGLPLTAAIVDELMAIVQ